jgi:hypothetical protein
VYFLHKNNFMTQPTYPNLLGTDAAKDGYSVVIPLQVFTDAGITDVTTMTALEAFGVLLAKASTWLETNTDASVMASASSFVSAPSTRNGLEKTQFNHSISLYGSYTSPAFNPNDL